MRTGLRLEPVTQENVARLIYDGGQLVGVIMAAFAPEHKNPLFSSYLWRLNIDAGHATSPQVRIISRM